MTMKSFSAIQQDDNSNQQPQQQYYVCAHVFGEGDKTRFTIHSQ